MWFLVLQLIKCLCLNGKMEWNLIFKYFPPKVYEFKSRNYYDKNAIYFGLKWFHVTNCLQLDSKYELDGFGSDI